MSSMVRRHWGSWEDVRKRLRQLMVPRRVLIVAVCGFVVLYFFISFLFPFDAPSLTKSCIGDHIRSWKELEEISLASTSTELPVFVGNGFIGIGDDGELRIMSASQKVLSQKITFFPLITPKVPGASSEAKATVIDYRTGIAKTIRCFTMIEECVCVTRSFYAYRTRPHVFVQDIVTTNPTHDSVKVELTTASFSNWTKGEKVDKTFVYSHVLDVDGIPNALGVICSFVPKEIVVEQKREESERFLCVVNYEPMKPSELMDGRKRMSTAVSKEFADVLSIGTAALDREHENAWRNLNTVTFGISKSLAPGVLNPEIINATRYALLSNVRAPLLENVVFPERRKEAHMLMYKRQENMCYSGHSTLFIPRTALWKISNSIDNLIHVTSVWIVTLEQHGCANLVKAGASGVAQGFVLSLIAGKFTPHHLEIKLEPADLHREITAVGLLLSDVARFSVAVKLDFENRPYMLASSTSQVYACDAGCLNSPERLSGVYHMFSVKVTKPLTPILYISDNKHHLEQLRNTIHVVEVVNAPAHEQELIALHKHGHRLGGLPVAFWVLLGALVVIFHLFLFKLLYSEWKKADYTPYNYYLRQRYVRSH